MLAVIGFMQHLNFFLGIEPHDAVMEIGTRYQLIVGIKIHAIGSFGTLKPESDPLVFVPHVNTVVRLVGKEYLTLRIYSRTFGEGVAGGDSFNLSVISDDAGVLSPNDRR